MIEMNDQDRAWMKELHAMRQKHKWLKVILAIMTILVLFFMYQMVRRENLVKVYHHTVVKQAGYEIYMAKSDLEAAMGHEDGERYILVKSALEHIEDTTQIFRMPYAYYNFKRPGKSQLIGNGAAREYFNHYIYLINDWLWSYEEEGQTLEDDSIQKVVMDLEAFLETFVNDKPRPDNPTIEMMDYDQLKALFADLLQKAQSDFTYESFLYPLD